MILPLLAVLFGLGVLAWSADRFVDGASAAANHLGMPPLLIGMLVLGFGTSAPELAVAVLAALQGNPGVAIGNAYGSNITNIGLIIGLTALIHPITVSSRILRKELPVLLLVTALAAYQLVDGTLSRTDGLILLLAFFGLISWSIAEGFRHRSDALAGEVELELETHPMPLRRALLWLGVGLLLVIGSSKLLVLGAVAMARGLGISDLLIGLTIVAVGTSLPELVTAIVATRKGEHEIALGNVLGSNLFNTLAVVGVAAVIAPVDVPPEVISRDMLVMGMMSVALFAFAYGFRSTRRVNRLEGSVLLTGYFAFMGVLVAAVVVH